MESVRTEMTPQVWWLGNRADYPVASDFVFQVGGEDFADALVRGGREEAGQRNAVAGPGVAGKNAEHIAVVVELDPGQLAFEPQPMGLVQFNRRRQVVVRQLNHGRAGFAAKLGLVSSLELTPPGRKICDRKILLFTISPQPSTSQLGIEARFL
jgi:hypothetical protein